jgi:hypothetical protein
MQPKSSGAMKKKESKSDFWIGISGSAARRTRQESDGRACFEQTGFGAEVARQ